MKSETQSKLDNVKAKMSAGKGKGKSSDTA